LAPLRNGLEVIKLARNDVEKVESMRIMMERQLQQMTRLVDDLLDVSRISQGKLALRKENVSLASIINAAVETCGPLIQENNHELTIALPDRALYVNADKARLSQVLSNLLNNAAKYTNRGGKIWLSAECNGTEAAIRVRDTGIGINSEMLPKIFDLFTQVDHSIEKSQSGLGVGLNIVRRIVEMHGGSVGAHSQGNGMGSEFIVRLPIIPPDKHGQPVPIDEPKGRSTTSRRVLVADDNRDAAISLATILKMMGHNVQTANDGMEAVTLAGEFFPDVLFLDIGMPRLNGYEACRRIREQPWGRRLYLVALTGWGQEEDRARSKEAGFDAHLVKPLEPMTLHQLLADMPDKSAN
jgi:CheY-like chemotaxis protein